VLVESSDALLEALGTSVIADVKPADSPANLSTALAEFMREGVPKYIGHAIWHTRLSKLLPRGISKDYLGIEFGWKPLVADITDFFGAVLEADRIIAQYERDAGRVVRRRREFPPELSESVTVVAENVRPFLPANATALTRDLPPAEGRVFRRVNTYRKRWFSGAFMYFLPEDYHSRNKLRDYAARLDKVYGLAITPEVLWNLAPWSWAADWMGNVGDVISNATAWSKDGLILKYGYMMEHSLSTHTYTYEGPVYYTGFPRPAPLVLSVEVKKRVQASPFGFGLTWESFTARQQAILAALSITRARKGTR